MTRRIRIPFLVDLITVDKPDHIRALSNDARLDRKYLRAGPLLNRVISRRIRRVLSVDAHQIPSALPRDDEARIAAQHALAQRLTSVEIPAHLSTPAVDALVGVVTGENTRADEALVQEFVGRLFVPTYAANSMTWRAAVHVDTALRSNNPIRQALWRLTGKTRRAQHSLSEAVGGDLAGVHATGIAVHTLREAVEHLRDFYRDKDLRVRLTPIAAAGRALLAPNTVMRQALPGAQTGELTDDLSKVGPLNAGTLVQLQTRRAGTRSLDPNIIFMRDSWSYCPAHELVPALLMELWARATTQSQSR